MSTAVGEISDIVNEFGRPISREEFQEAFNYLKKRSLQELPHKHIKENLVNYFNSTKKGIMSAFHDLSNYFHQTRNAQTNDSGEKKSELYVVPPNPDINRINLGSELKHEFFNVYGLNDLERPQKTAFMQLIENYVGTRFPEPGGNDKAGKILDLKTRSNKLDSKKNYYQNALDHLVYAFTKDYLNNPIFVSQKVLSELPALTAVKKPKYVSTPVYSAATAA